MFLLSCLLQGLSGLGCCLSWKIIVLRAFLGIAASFCLPSAVSIINKVFSPGKPRNVAFASMGSAQPVPFNVSLVLGSVITSTIG